MKKITRVDLANIFLVAASASLLANIILIAIYGAVIIDNTLRISESNPLVLAAEFLLVSWFIYFGLNNIRRETKRHNLALVGVGIPIIWR